VETNISHVTEDTVYSVVIGDANNDGGNEILIGLYEDNRLRMYEFDYNPLFCGSLAQGQTCQLNWTVNIMGTYGTQYWLDANFTSNYSQVASNDSGNFQINITYPYGWFNITYQSPVADSSQNVTRYSLFNVTMNVTCVGGICGEVFGALRYNSSGLNPDANVSKFGGTTPFYAVYGSQYQYHYRDFLETNISNESADV
jgi:hypothetical protein